MVFFQHSHDYVSVILIIASALVYFLVNNYYSYEDVFVETVTGKVKGYTAKSRDGRIYSQFNSIPYAKAPIGPLRFEPPQKLEKWEGTRDVSSLPDACIQFDFLWRRVLGNEDCLYLAISTKVPNEKENKERKLLPVMVFIHGGHFMFGSVEIYGGSYLMDEDIVLVVLQYRVGAFGFLNSGDDIVSGNMGLKDQNAALKWVQENIKAFGGDPNQVTLFGESAGGASVHHHMMADMSKGLFHRAISQSGSSLCPWAYTREPKKQAVHLGKQLNCPTGNSRELVSCLKSIKAEEIAETHKAQLEPFVDPINIFGPTIETYSEENKDKTFLSESPYKMAYDGKYSNKVPLIMGVNSDEGCFRSAYIIHKPDVLNELTSEWNSVAKYAFLLHDKGTPEITEKIWTHYFGASEHKNLSISNYRQLTDVYTDRYFYNCVRDAAVLYAKTKMPTYMYYFTFQQDMSVGNGLASCTGEYPVLLEITLDYFKTHFYRWMGWKTFNYGVCHADDISYLFYTLIFVDINTKSPEYENSKKLVKLWASFAKDGTPMKLGDVKWEPIKSDRKQPLKYLLLGKEVKIIDDPVESRASFWKSLNIPRNLEPELESKYQDIL